MGIKRKCYLCDATTWKPLNDFYEIGWNAFSINRKPSICFCPKHSDKIDEIVDKYFSKLNLHGLKEK